MWPFKQRKTFTADICIPIDIATPQTADLHRLEEFVACFDCGQLVLKDKAKEVEHRYLLGLWPLPNQATHHCPTHAPDWDVVCHSGPFGNTHINHYRRLPAVPEGLEEIVKAPKPKAKKSKTSKGGN